MMNKKQVNQPAGKQSKLNRKTKVIRRIDLNAKSLQNMGNLFDTNYRNVDPRSIFGFLSKTLCI